MSLIKLGNLLDKNPTEMAVKDVINHSSQESRRESSTSAAVCIINVTPTWGI